MNKPSDRVTAPQKLYGEHDRERWPTGWSFACPCIRCAWEAWWDQADSDVATMPTEAHPDGDFKTYWEGREFWNSHGHHPRS